MPELPEIETLARSLSPIVDGPRITSVRAHRADVVRTRSGSDPTPRELLVGGKVGGLVRLGKQLAIIGETGSVICVHLGMSGQLLHIPAADRAEHTHVHVEWRLADGSRLLFRDPRRFGGLWCFPSLASLHEERWSELGPDALTIRTAQLRGALAGSSRAIKAALLDQRAVAGVGNIYADEALHRAGIHPHRPCTTLREDEWKALASAVRSVLRQAVFRGGSTLRDYVDSGGRAGGFQAEHRVYGRGGEPCKACKGLIVRTVLAQRSTCHCPSCQPERVQ